MSVIFCLGLCHHSLFNLNEMFWKKPSQSFSPSWTNRGTKAWETDRSDVTLPKLSWILFSTRRDVNICTFSSPHSQLESSYFVSLSIPPSIPSHLFSTQVEAGGEKDQKESRKRVTTPRPSVVVQGTHGTSSRAPPSGVSPYVGAPVTFNTVGTLISQE